MAIPKQKPSCKAAKMLLNEAAPIILRSIKIKYGTIDSQEKQQRIKRCDVCVITNKQEIADLAGGNAVLLPPECEGVAGGFACATVIQLFACELSVQRGNNPDAPEGLTKVTVTV